MSAAYCTFICFRILPSIHVPDLDAHKYLFIDVLAHIAKD
jgi:hypothetical protein